jgi:hypothetical protein
VRYVNDIILGRLNNSNLTNANKLYVNFPHYKHLKLNQIYNMTDTEYKLGEHRALTPFHLYFTDLSGRVSLANVAFSYRRPTNKPHSFRSCALRIRYRGTHATQKWDISFAAHRSAESRRLKRWQTLSLYAALIYATVYEMNVLNPWWWVDDAREDN